MARTHCFRTDWNRLLKNYPIYLAVLGVALSLLLSLESYAFQEGMVNCNVVDTYFRAVNSQGQMIAYVFCAVPFAAVFCEDLEHRYLRCSIGRTSVKKYVLSKAVTIYACSVLVMILGTVLFLIYVSIQTGWTSDSFQKDFYVAGMYRSLILEEHYAVYMILCALQRGMLAGALSLFASFVSLFISNKMVTFVTPVLAYQILQQFAGNGWAAVQLFDPAIWSFDSDFQYFLLVSGVCIIPSVLFTGGIYAKIKARL